MLSIPTSQPSRKGDAQRLGTSAGVSIASGVPGVERATDLLAEAASGDKNALATQFS